VAVDNLNGRNCLRGELFTDTLEKGTLKKSKEGEGMSRGKESKSSHERDSAVLSPNLREGKNMVIQSGELWGKKELLVERHLRRGEKEGVQKKGGWRGTSARIVQSNPLCVRQKSSAEGRTVMVG